MRDEQQEPAEEMPTGEAFLEKYYTPELTGPGDDAVFPWQR
jgi:hypothetical protein